MGDWEGLPGIQGLQGLVTLYQSDSQIIVFMGPEPFTKLCRLLSGFGWGDY